MRSLHLCNTISWEMVETPSLVTHCLLKEKSGQNMIRHVMRSKSIFKREVKSRDKKDCWVPTLWARQFYTHSVFTSTPGKDIRNTLQLRQLKLKVGSLLTSTVVCDRVRELSPGLLYSWHKAFLFYKRWYVKVTITERTNAAIFKSLVDEAVPPPTTIFALWYHFVFIL